jgi:murein lipoprotein
LRKGLIEVNAPRIAGEYSSDSKLMGAPLQETNMRTTMKRFLSVSLLLAPLALGSCASQSEVDQLRSDLSKAQAAADAAQTEARAAKADAAAANTRADEATKAAADVSRKADRMYDRSLRK